MTTLYGVIWRWWDLPGEGINHVESGRCWIRIGKKPKRPLRMRLDDRENKPALKSGFDKAWGIDHARITRRTGQIPGSARDAFLVGDAPRRGLIPPLAMRMQDAWCVRNQRRVRRRRFARTFRE